MSSNLDEYNKKRDFEKSGEPKGRAEAKSKAKLCYVVQRHMARREHYDFRLEWNGVLLSWAVPKGPSLNPADKRLSVEVEPHPLEYKDFEGTIPKGEYGGGTVMLWDEGSWEPLGDADKSLQEGVLKFVLHGARLKGKWSLIRLKRKEGEKQKNWLLVKDRDEYDQSYDGLGEHTTSVRTRRTMQEIEFDSEIKDRNPFDRAKLQLAKLVGKVPDDGDWIFEIKYDGYRIAAFVERGSVKLLSRNNIDYSRHFKRVSSSLLTLSRGRAMVLDGEAVIIDEGGKSDFQRLQNHMRKNTLQDVTYMVFDILALGGSSGLAATGTHQVFKQLHKDKEDKNGGTKE